MRKVHVLIPFSRHDLLGTLIEAYGKMRNVIVHPLTYFNETPVETDKDWVQPYVAPITRKGPYGAPLINSFLRSGKVVEEDLYVTASDNDMYEQNVFSSLLETDDSVIVISMKRGYRIPLSVPSEKAYAPSPLIAGSKNMTVGLVEGEQIFMRGTVAREVVFDDSRDSIACGLVAEYLKSRYFIRYEPNLFALFNYYEPERWRLSNVVFGALVNDLGRLDMVLHQSEIDPHIRCHTIKMPSSATYGLNKILELMEKDGYEIGVLTHQDMFYRNGWTDKIQKCVDELPESWVIAGPIGKDKEGCIKGLFHDMRIPLLFDYGPLPVEASCLDECCIIVNLKKGFRFDETLKGFDLYGSLAVLQAEEMGGTAWIIEAFCEHYCLRPFSWFPDKAFEEEYRWLHERFPGQYIDSTVMGVPREELERERNRLRRSLDTSRIPTSVSDTSRTEDRV
jgi:hypothetical protein